MPLWCGSKMPVTASFRRPYPPSRQWLPSTGCRISWSPKFSALPWSTASGVRRLRWKFKHLGKKNSTTKTGSWGKKLHKKQRNFYSFLGHKITILRHNAQKIEILGHKIDHFCTGVDRIFWCKWVPHASRSDARNVREGGGGRNDKSWWRGGRKRWAEKREEGREQQKVIEKSFFKNFFNFWKE